MLNIECVGCFQVVTVTRTAVMAVSWTGLCHLPEASAPHASCRRAAVLGKHSAACYPALRENSREMIFIQKGAFVLCHRRACSPGNGREKRVSSLLPRILLWHSLHPAGCRKELSIAVEDEMFYSFVHSAHVWELTVCQTFETCQWFEPGQAVPFGLLVFGPAWS